MKRRFYRATFHRLKFDLVVAGEAPLAGTILESTLSAVSLGIPVCVLDNAYSPELAQTFVDLHGPMLDGLILTGPSSFQMAAPPGYYCAAPPYIQGTPQEAVSLLKEFGFVQGQLITILGYERKAEQLGLALLADLPQDCRVIVLSPDTTQSTQRIAMLPESVRTRIRVLPPPGENLLFGLLHASNLVIGKCGFMQVSECLALGTPFIGIEYRGCMHPAILHPEAVRFVHATASVIPDEATRNAALKFLRTQREDLRHLHDGTFGGASVVADFLERLPAGPRLGTLEECARSGYSRDVLERALTSRYPEVPISVERIRYSRLRNLQSGFIDSLAVSYRRHRTSQTAFLWGRQYISEETALEDLRSSDASGRRVLLSDIGKRLLIEEDVGESFLPPISI